MEENTEELPNEREIVADATNDLESILEELLEVTIKIAIDTLSYEKTGKVKEKDVEIEKM